jgi:uncharacterized protein (DUF2267 family)
MRPKNRQSLNRFYQRVAEKAGISADQTVELTQFLLGSILRRVSYTLAANFMAQLPRALHEDLLSLSPGPDRTITRDWIFLKLMSRFYLSEVQATSVLTHFYLALEEWVSPGEIRNLKAQLPPDLRELFEHKKVA